MSDFHMVVCVKAVPGSTEVKMDPKTNTIVRDGKQAVINPFDASALECALALKDDFIGFGMDVRVTVVSWVFPRPKRCCATASPVAPTTRCC